jgi:putative heme-binding domain-containing protein
MLMNSSINSRKMTWAVTAGVFALAATQVLAQSGDTEKGKALVASSGCLKCHRIGENGSRVGPNLSSIGERRTPERLETSILKPDEEVLPENRFVSVVLKDGTTVRGRLLNHDAISVQLIDSKEQLRSFRTADINGFTILTKGLMPSFAGKLSAAQVADIVAYLSSLKGSE